MLALVTACTQNNPLPVDGPPVYSMRTVEASDSSGVSQVSCPTTHRIMGGGGHCDYDSARGSQRTDRLPQ